MTFCFNVKMCKTKTKILCWGGLLHFPIDYQSLYGNRRIFKIFLDDSICVIFFFFYHEMRSSLAKSMSLMTFLSTRKGLEIHISIFKLLEVTFKMFCSIFTVGFFPLGDGQGFVAFNSRVHKYFLQYQDMMSGVSTLSLPADVPEYSVVLLF